MLFRFLKKVFFTLVCLAIGVGFASIYMPTGHAPLPVLAAVFNPAEAAFAQKKSLYILLLGLDYSYDSRAQRHTKDARTDTIILVRVEPRGQKLSMLSVPRDLLVPIANTGGYDKINAAYSQGGVANTKRTVEQFLGITIDHHVVVKSDVIEDLVNGLGGVPITVEKDMDYDDNWAGLHIHLKAGEQILNGKNAVGYLRFRHDEEGDFGRIRRQQQFLVGLVKELKRKKHWPHYKTLADTVARKMTTDLRPEQMVGLGTLYRNFAIHGMRKDHVQVADYFENEVAYLVPVEGEPKATMKKLFPPLPDPSLRNIPVVIEDYRTGDQPRLQIVNRFQNGGFGTVSARQPGRDGETTEDTRLVIQGQQSEAAVRALKALYPNIPLYSKESQDNTTVVLRLKDSSDIR